MHIVITGADGFIGKNLCLRLAELKWTPNLRQVFKWDTVQRNG